MKNIFSICFLIFTSILSGQGIKDSVFSINQVEITSYFNFLKEEAGMKEIRIDTFILEQKLNLNLSDLLAENSSLIIKDYGRGALSTVSFRGTAPSHTQVTWNGMNINSPMLGMVDFSLIPVFIIDQLDIQHGTASISSQSGGIGGLISIENKPDWNNQLGGKLYYDQGSFHTRNIFAQIDLGTNFFQSKTRIYTNNSRNNYEFVNKNIIEIDHQTGEFYHPLQQNRNADYKKSGITQEFYYRDASKWYVSNKTWLQVAQRSIPTVLSKEYSESNLNISTNQNDQTIKNSTEINRYWSKTKFKLNSGFDIQDLYYGMLSQISGLGSNQNVDSDSKMKSWSNSIQVEHDFLQKVSGEVKASYNHHNIASYDEVLQTGYDTIRSETSIFGGLYYTPTPKIQFSTQVRKDFISDYQAPTIFALGFNYKPFKIHDIIFKGNISRNYHYPTLNDLYWQPGGNPELKPEEGYSSEISGLYSVKIYSFSLKSSITAYYTKINNWIMWLPAFRGYWEAVNIKEVRAFGMESSLSLLYSYQKTAFRLNGNLALTRSMNFGDPLTLADESYGQQLPFIPKISGNVFLSVRNRGFYIIYQNNSMGMRYLLSSNTGIQLESSDEASSLIKAENFYTLYPHYLNKMTLGKSIDFSNSKLTVELFIDNLFNETYRNVLQRIMPGRSYNVHLKYEF